MPLHPLQHKKPLSILIADDNFATQKLISLILRKNGYSIDTAINGIDVLSKLSQKTFDLILMDCNMPQMNGIETTQKIRAESAFKDIIIIAMTPLIKNINREICCGYGMDDYLPKPITKESLLECMKAWETKLGRNKKLI